MAEVTQADVDAAINDLNDAIQQKRGLPPIKPVPDSLASQPQKEVTQEDVDAAIEKLNNEISAKQGATANPVKAAEAQPARPQTLPYIGGQAEVGLATGGHNVGQANQAELYDMGFPVEPPSSKPAPVAGYNKEAYGGNGQVVAPNAFARYVGAGVNALASNPFAVAAGGPGSLLAGTGGVIGGALGSQAGTDLQPYLPDALKPYAPFVGGLVGGVAGAGVPYGASLASGESPTMARVRSIAGEPPYGQPPTPPSTGLTAHPDIIGAMQTPAMMPGASSRTVALEAALRKDPRTASLFAPIDENNMEGIKDSLGRLDNQTLGTHFIDAIENTHDPIHSMTLTTNGRLDPTKLKDMISAVVEEPLIAGPVSVRDKEMLNKIRDLVERQHSVTTATPSDLSREGVNRLTHFLAGEPSLQNYLLGHGLNMLLAQGPEPISQSILGGFQLARYMARPSAVRRAMTNNDNAVNSLGAQYTGN